jgi:hypothetical protein
MIFVREINPGAISIRKVMTQIIDYSPLSSSGGYSLFLFLQGPHETIQPKVLDCQSHAQHEERLYLPPGKPSR